MSTPVCYSYVESPIGRLLLVADEAGLREISFRSQASAAQPKAAWVENAPAVKKPARGLGAYFPGELEDFTVPLAPRGTPFQQRVWSELLNIPYGETISYGELARRIGNPKASRAVGLANGSNPIPIMIPCHRVIGSNGKLTGYGGGLPIKEKLIALERRQLSLL